MVDCALEQVDDVAGNFATVLAADGGKVKVKLARPADFDSTFVEFVGTVDAPNQISEIDRTSFGNTFGAPHRVNLGLAQCKDAAIRELPCLLLALGTQPVLPLYSCHCTYCKSYCLC